jgi:hypothetical protein
MVPAVSFRLQLVCRDFHGIDLLFKNTVVTIRPASKYADPCSKSGEAGTPLRLCVRCWNEAYLLAGVIMLVTHGNKWHSNTMTEDEKIGMLLDARRPERKAAFAAARRLSHEGILDDPIDFPSENMAFVPPSLPRRRVTKDFCP